MSFICSFAKRRDAAAAHAQEETPGFEKVHWTRDPGLRRLYFHISVLFLGSATSGYDGQFFNAVQVFPTWQAYFGHPTGSYLGLIGALYLIGGICASLVVPPLADRFGRKPPIALGCVLMATGAVVQGTARGGGGGAFCGGRVLLGGGNAFAQLCAPMLIAELAHPQHRGRLTAVYNCVWNVGAVVVTWLSFGTDYMRSDWSWRIPALLQATPAVLLILLLYWVPESPRYLMARDRHDEALEILATYHANGNAQHPTVQFEYREIKETIRLEMETKKSGGYLDFLRTKGNRHRLLLLLSLGLFSQWSGNAIISNYANQLYTQAGITSSNAIFGLSGGLTIMSLLVSTTTATLVDRLGRRPLFLAATGGMFAVFVPWTLCAALWETRRVAGANDALVVCVWLFGLCYALAWTGLLVAYAVEILPYRLRARGLLLMQLTAQAALCLNTYANPVAFAAFGDDGVWRLYLIYTCWIFLECCFIYFFYVETKGPTLEELARVFDGQDAKVARVDLQQVEKEMAIGGGNSGVGNGAA